MKIMISIYLTLLIACFPIVFSTGSPISIKSSHESCLSIGDNSKWAVVDTTDHSKHKNKKKTKKKHSTNKKEDNETGKMNDMDSMKEMDSNEMNSGTSKSHMNKNSSMAGMDMGKMNMQKMNGGILITDPMAIEASGTSWQPQSTPMYMTMYDVKKWMIMLHGDIKLRYNSQGGSRGKNQISAPNWFMIMGQRKLSESAQIMLRTMISLDRLTEGGDGYPLLFQTGETWHNLRLIDRQHPHDLISELSASISKEFSQNFSGYLYLGYPGEPALGPPVFMHRISASPNPDAPIGHHWQDATHITFGVMTAGFAYKNIKFEASYFNGREPDENRFDFERPRFDSYSGRISYNPFRDLALQFSSGVIKNPDGTDASETVYRTTASALYSIINGGDSFLSIAFIWGVNNEAHSSAQQSFLIEPAYKFSDNTLYARLELVQKPRHELGIETGEFQNENVGAYTLGYMRKVTSFSGIDLNAGMQGSIYSMSELVKQYYGNPFSFEIYIGINPSLMIH
ncbi:MAG TPA: hypothetical protein VHO43_03740 [Ignavibacteriales bacterium]|nr:hypothetical protein [Ignavibacteriales bacterium]